VLNCFDGGAEENQAARGLGECTAKSFSSPHNQSAIWQHWMRQWQVTDPGKKGEVCPSKMVQDTYSCKIEIALLAPRSMSCGIHAFKRGGGRGTKITRKWHQILLWTTMQAGLLIPVSQSASIPVSIATLHWHSIRENNIDASHFEFVT
jgi:hypothetical protein